MGSAQLSKGVTLRLQCKKAELSHATGQMERIQQLGIQETKYGSLAVV